MDSIFVCSRDRTRILVFQSDEFGLGLFVDAGEDLVFVELEGDSGAGSG